MQQGRIWAGSMQLSFVSAQAPPGHSVCPSLCQGTDVFPCFGVAFVLAERSRSCSLTQLRSCRSQARVTARLGFGWGCPLDSEWLFLARGRKHREVQKCVFLVAAVCTGTCREAAGGKVVHKRAKMILDRNYLVWRTPSSSHLCFQWDWSPHVSLLSVWL